MKKHLTVAALLAAGTAFSNAAITVHDTEFNNEFNTAVALHSQGITLASSNVALTGPLSGKSAYTNVSAVQGLYLADGVGVKFNTAAAVSVTYLYIGDGIAMKQSDSNTAGQINWSNTSGGGFSVASTAGAWIDINADYGSNISLASMSSGSVYLNTSGKLSSALAGTNTVYASALFDLDKISSLSSYSLSDDSAVVTRTLLSGDYTDWAGTVSVFGVEDYTVIKDSSGLKISYAIPEPSAFGLLAGAGALALVAARRRRAK